MTYFPSLSKAIQMEQHGVMIGHRPYENIREYPTLLTIEKGTETRKEIKFPEFKDIEGMTIIGFYVIRQWNVSGMDPIPSCEAKNPLLSLQAMCNTWVTLKDHNSNTMVYNHCVAVEE